MSNVYNRLFKESISKKSSPRRNMKIDLTRKEEEKKWQKILAAECYLSSDTPSNSVPNNNINISSLSTSPLPKNKKTPHINNNINLSKCPQKAVSVILSSDKSIVHTDYYMITDSVEPPPYKYLKPNQKLPPSTPRREKIRISNERTKYQQRQEQQMEIEKLQKIVRANKTKPATYGGPASGKERLVTPAQVKECDCEKSNPPESPRIMLDLVEPLQVEDKPIPPLNLISGTGICWEMYGYPNSLSFILKDK